MSMAEQIPRSRYPGGIGPGWAFLLCFLLTISGSAAQNPDLAKGITKAKDYLQSGRLDRADREISKVLEAAPASVEAHIFLCDLRQIQRRRADAVAACRRASDLAPTRADLLIKIGDLFRQRKEDTDEALRAYRRAVERDPSLALPHVRIGSIMESRDQLEAAAAEYQEAMRINPNLVRANVGLGAVLFKADKLVEARRYLARAIELSPRDLRSHIFLGLALNHAGQLDLALQEIRAAATADPHAANAVAGVREQAARFELLRKHFLNELAQNPKDSTYSHNVSVLSYFLRDYEISWNYLIKAQRLGYPVHGPYKEVVYSRWKSGGR
jgi:Tfp pilus assembly protein PilF